MTKGISGFAVLFDFGALPGKSCGIFTQSDVVQTYGQSLYEGLLDHDVYTEFVDTRKRPHKETQEYLEGVPDYFVSLILSCGWDETDGTKRNISKIECSPDCLRLSKRISESLYDWGKGYVYGHTVSEPAVMPGTSKRIVIKPFRLNGDNASEYLVRLDSLGKDVARTIGDWSKEYGLAGRRR